MCLQYFNAYGLRVFTVKCFDQQIVNHNTIGRFCYNTNLAGSF